MKKTIIVSAVALHEGGPLTVLKECLSCLSRTLSGRYRIIALVHDAARIPAEKNIEYWEYKRARQNWLFRLYYEYIYFFFLSRRLRPYLWFSLHDITPNVTAEVRAVYCQNPSPFYRFSFHSLAVSPALALFSLFYKYLYRINIRKNDRVVVQQEWIRMAFEKMFGIRDVVVAYPIMHNFGAPTIIEENTAKTTFFYPAFPRVFKNLEVVAEAARLLYEQGRSDFKVIMTIDGKENSYARQIVARYKDVPTILFIGILPHDEVYRLYGHARALIFSSKLETWGLPISEFKGFSKSMLLPDLPYAHETLGDYDKVKFFDPNDPHQLAEYMKHFLDGSLVYDGNRKLDVREPFAQNWEELFSILLNVKQMTSD